MGNPINEELQGNLKRESVVKNQDNENDINKNLVSSERNALSRSKYIICDNILGKGSFGVVLEALVIETNSTVAIKKVIQDPKYKNRELAIMKSLYHPNIVTLKDYFYTEQPSESGEINRYLNVVMEYIPDNVFRVLKNFAKNNQFMPVILVKIYIYQLCRSLGYLHCLGICHRDVKPQNLLVDSKTHVLKLCDFGSSKRLVPGEYSVPYICSRFYRAPELIMGANQYSNAVDAWSIGCVLGELLLGRPLFAGESAIDQLIKIIKILGTPTKSQLIALSPNFSEYELPVIKIKDLQKVFGNNTSEDAVDLISKFLRYEPEERLKPLEALAHSFFDELRCISTSLPSGNSLPDLFSFTETELNNMTPSTFQKVIPSWYKNNSS